MELKNRARSYHRIANALFAQKKMRGELMKATRGARHLSLFIRLRNPLRLDTALKLAEPLALATNTPAVVAGRMADAPGLVAYQFQLQHGYWQSYTRRDVTGLGLGLGESRRQIDFSFEPPHALVAGTTDSGKTETVRSILTGLFTSYQPDKLNALIIDPHYDYEDFTNAAHLRGFPIAHDQEQVSRVLTYADQEMARRKAANQRNAPRLVVAIDEGETILDGDWLAITQRIAAEGRKWHINLVISTQKPTQRNMPDLVDKLNNRWVGLVDNAHTSALLTGQAGLECHKLTGQGDFVHVAGAAQERLQVALATRTDLDRIPRAEMDPPEVEGQDSPRSQNFEDNDRGPGRPSIQPEPVLVARYLFRGPDTISITQARDWFGLTRTGHYANRDFARDVKAELLRLMELAKRG